MSKDLDNEKEKRYCDLCGKELINLETVTCLKCKTKKYKEKYRENDRKWVKKQLEGDYQVIDTPQGRIYQKKSDNKIFIVSEEEFKEELNKISREIGIKKEDLETSFNDDSLKRKLGEKLYTQKMEFHHEVFEKVQKQINLGEKKCYICNSSKLSFQCLVSDTMVIEVEVSYKCAECGYEKLEIIKKS